MGDRRVSHLGHQTDPQPRTARAGLSKTLGAATPSQPLKKVPDILATIAATSGKPLELWFQDEARIGQKNKVTRRWAARGTRPFVLKDQRTASAYIFGAICPALGKTAGLVLPSCNTEAMTLHLQEIALARRAWCPRRSVRGSGRVACHREAGRARKHHTRPAAVQVTRAQSRREHLAIHAR
jgi:hypothetical protein